jgi:hypothetical protein
VGEQWHTSNNFNIKMIKDYWLKYTEHTKTHEFKPCMVAHVYNPSTGEAEAGGQGISGRPGLHIEICLQKKNRNKSKTKQKTHEVRIGKGVVLETARVSTHFFENW